MKKIIFISTALLFAKLTIAQFNCDPNNFMENPMLEKKVQEFEYSCMQYALNVSQNVNHNMYVQIMDSKGRNVSVPALLITPTTKGETTNWKVEYTGDCAWEPTVGGTRKMYQQPGLITNEGKKITLSLISVELDTSKINLNLQEAVTKYRKSNKKYSDLLEVSSSNYYQSGKKYALITGVFLVPESGIKPSKLGDVVAFFYLNFCGNYMWELKEREKKGK
jgi:hypothetical protein